jgi:hypothetical protein
VSPRSSVDLFDLLVQLTQNPSSRTQPHSAQILLRKNAFFASPLSPYSRYGKTNGKTTAKPEKTPYRQELPLDSPTFIPFARSHLQPPNATFTPSSCHIHRRPFSIIRLTLRSLITSASPLRSGLVDAK